MAFGKVLGLETLREPISRSPLLVSAAILLVGASLVVFLLSRPKRLDLPVVGKSGSVFYGDDILEGVAKVFSSIHLLRSRSDIYDLLVS
jgi:hypothetical protein